MRKKYVVYLDVLLIIFMLSAYSAKTETDTMIVPTEVTVNDNEIKDETEQQENSRLRLYHANCILTRGQAEDIVYILTKRAMEYTTEAVVTYRNDSEYGYIIAVELPTVEDNSTFAAITQKNDLEIISNYQKDNQTVELTGKDVKSATASWNDSNVVKEPIVNIRFTEEGTEKFARVTTEHIGEVLTICFNGEVLSSPIIKAPIIEGNVWLTGLTSYAEAENLAKLLNEGSFEYELTEIVK